MKFSEIFLELCLGLVFWHGVIRKYDFGMLSLMQYSFEVVFNGMLMDDFGMLGFPHAFLGTFMQL
jgi:hypothetical protein